MAWKNVGNGLQQEIIDGEYTERYRFIKTPGYGDPFLITDKISDAVEAESILRNLQVTSERDRAILAELQLRSDIDLNTIQESTLIYGGGLNYITLSELINKFPKIISLSGTVTYTPSLVSASDADKTVLFDPLTGRLTFPQIINSDEFVKVFYNSVPGNDASVIYARKSELNSFILYNNNDTSDVYRILRSIIEWYITGKLVPGSFFYVVRVGLELGVPTIIINNGSGNGQIKFVRSGEFSGTSIYIGTEISSTSGWSGKLSMPTTMSNIVAATNYTSPSTTSSPYAMTSANIIIVPSDFYSKTETDSRIAAKPDLNVDALVTKITGQDPTVYGILTSGILSYKIYETATLAGINFFVGKVGIDQDDTAVPKRRCIRIINGSALPIIEFKEVQTESVSEGWILLKGVSLNNSGMNGWMKMDRNIWSTISSVDYNSNSGLFSVHRSNFIYVPVQSPAASAPKKLYLSSPSGVGSPSQLPEIYNKIYHFVNDITCISAGDSLTGRTINNTQYTDPQYRGPLLNGMNIGSAIWEKIKRGPEKFWRYDALYSGVNRFIESGVFVTVEPNQYDTPSHGISSNVWDDYVRHEANTRMFNGVGSASVTFNMIDTSEDKEGSLDFIYRTTLDGCNICTVSIAEGNGRAVVFDEITQTWIELNGYVFSMKHPPVSAYRGNTKFNARLRIKAVTNTFDSRNQPKTITITKTDTSDSKFMYWGIQTSIERYMVRFINSARGGLALPTLLPYVDDDVWDHNPDFIIHEIPINGGINVPGGVNPPQYYVDQWDNWMFSSTNSMSLREKSKISGVPWKKFELIVWSPYCSYGCYESDNVFKSQKYSDGNWWGPMDNRKQISLLMDEKKENGFEYIDVAQRIPLWSQSIYGNKRQALAQTSMNSESSFILDDVHPNDLGVQIMAQDILSPLDFK